MSSHDTWGQNGSGQRVPAPFFPAAISHLTAKKHGKSPCRRYSCRARHCRQASSTVQAVKEHGTYTKRSGERAQLAQKTPICWCATSRGQSQPLGAIPGVYQLPKLGSCREIWPGSLFLSAAEEAPHETVERHIRGILGFFWLQFHVTSTREFRTPRRSLGPHMSLY